jgi:hypothetical protein
MRIAVDRRPAGLLLLLLLVLYATHANADPILITLDNRAALGRALVFSTSGFPDASARDEALRGDSLTASAQAALDGTSTRANSRLVSTISPDMQHFRGFGEASSNTIGPRGDAASTAFFELAFELAAPLAFRFAGTFDSFGRGFWQTHLAKQVGEHQQSMRFSFINDTASHREINERGSLDPGRYYLTVRSDVATTTMFGDVPSSSSNFDFEFDLTPVPEPGSILLLTGGVASVLAGARRRMKARQTGN